MEGSVGYCSGNHQSTFSDMNGHRKNYKTQNYILLRLEGV